MSEMRTRALRACFVASFFFWIFLKICLFRVLQNSLTLTHEEALESENVQNVSALNAQLLRRERERERERTVCLIVVVVVVVFIAILLTINKL